MRAVLTHLQLSPTRQRRRTGSPDNKHTLIQMRANAAVRKGGSSDLPDYASPAGARNGRIKAAVVLRASGYRPVPAA